MRFRFFLCSCSYCDTKKPPDRGAAYLSGQTVKRSICESLDLVARVFVLRLIKKNLTICKVLIAPVEMEAASVERPNDHMSHSGMVSLTAC